jgi:hypothetical protein
MSKKPKDEEQDMTPLNVEIPTSTIALIRVAKAVTNKSIREIVREALEEWLRRRGLDKMPKAKEPE